MTATRPEDRPEPLTSDGRPLPHVEVAIVNPDGKPVPADVEGEIVTRGPRVFADYLVSPELNDPAFRREFWLRTLGSGKLVERLVIGVLDVPTMPFAVHKHRSLDSDDRTDGRTARPAEVPQPYQARRRRDPSSRGLHHRFDQPWSSMTCLPSWTPQA